MPTIKTDTYDIDISQISKKMGLTIKQQKQLQKELQKAQKEFRKGRAAGDSFLGSLIKFNVIGGIFRGITRAVGQSVMGLVTYNKEMAKLFAITNASKQEQKELRKTAEDLGKTTAFTAGEVAILQQEYAKLGFSIDQINDMAKATVNLAVFTENVGLTAETAGGAIKAFGLTAKDSQRIIDLMAKSFNTTALNLERYSEAAKDAFPIMNAFGSSAEDATAVMGALAEGMVTGSRAGTGIKTIFSDIRDETSAIAKVLGGTAQNMDEFVALLVKANEEGKDFSDEALVSLDKRSKAVVLGLVNQVGKLKELRIAYKDVDGTAQEMADKSLDNLAGSFTLLNSAISGLVTDKGTGTYNLLNKAVKAGIPLVKWLGDNFVKVGTIALTAVLIPALKITYGWIIGLAAKITIATGGLNILFAAITTFVANRTLEHMTRQQSNLNKELEDFNKNSKKYVSNLKEMSSELVSKSLNEAIIKLKDFKRQLRLSPEDTGLKEEIKGIEEFIKQLSIEGFKRFKSSIDGTKTSIKEIINELKLASGVLSKGEKIGISIEDEGEDEPDDIARFNTENEKFIKSLADKEIEIEKEKQDILNGIKEAAFEKDEERRAAILTSIQESIEVISTLQSGITDIFSQLANNRMIEIDNEYKTQKDNINKTIKDEDKKAKELAKLDKEYEDKKREEQKKTAELNKITSLFNIGINTAQAVMKAYTIDPTGILAGFVGSMGLIQAGVVASAPIPKFKDGIVNISGKGTGQSDSILANIANNESIVTARATQAGDNAGILTSMNGGQTFMNASGDMSQLINEVRGLKNVMAEQGAPVVNLENIIGRDGLTTETQQGNADFTNENNKTEEEASI